MLKYIHIQKDSDKYIFGRLCMATQKPEELAEQIKNAVDELNKAKDAQTAANKAVKEKREILNKLQNKESIVPLVYDVDISRLKVLCKEQAPIYGVKDLFEQVLKVKRNDGENKTKDIKDKAPYIYSQISQRIKEQGLRAIREHCILDDSSGRNMYIKSMKLNVKSNQTVNMKELDREIAIAKKMKELKSLQDENK